MIVRRRRRRKKKKYDNNPKMAKHLWSPWQIYIPRLTQGGWGIFPRNSSWVSVAFQMASVSPPVMPDAGEGSCKFDGKVLNAWCPMLTSLVQRYDYSLIPRVMQSSMMRWNSVLHSLVVHVSVIATLTTSCSILKLWKIAVCNLE